MAIFEPLQAELGKRTLISNATFFIVDFDSKPDEIEITVEEFPKHGRLYLAEQQMTATDKTKFHYSDVIDQLVSYSLDEKHVQQDEMRVRISDGLHATVSKYFINRVIDYKSLPVLEKNEGLQAISGKIFFKHFYFDTIFKNIPIKFVLFSLLKLEKIQAKTFI